MTHGVLFFPSSAIQSFVVGRASGLKRRSATTRSMPRFPAFQTKSRHGIMLAEYTSTSGDQPFTQAHSCPSTTVVHGLDSPSISPCIELRRVARADHGNVSDEMRLRRRAVRSLPSALVGSQSLAVRCAR
ncbi:hypothetical protein B0H12DRAFT_526382 [Mycena haematopus]|nr:hypothetical protein B0H12DRAFT_526382 [Mycena haematopus]